MEKIIVCIRRSSFLELHTVTSSFRFLSGEVLELSPLLPFLLTRLPTPGGVENMSSAYSISSPYNCKNRRTKSNAFLYSI